MTPALKKRYQATLNDIPALSEQIANRIRGGEIIALIGPLGSGKTTFAKSLAKKLGIRRRVTSPTFTLLNAYPIKPKALTLYHLDLYRTRSFNEVVQLGLLEIWERRDAIVLIEWADMIKKRLPKKTIYIYFEHEKTARN